MGTNYDEEKSFLDKLWDGDWKYLNIVMSNPVTDMDFKKIRALAHGAAAANNPSMLYHIYVIVRMKFRDPGAEEITNRNRLVTIVEDSGMYPDMSRMSIREISEYWNSRIKGYCIDIVREIIYSACKMEDNVLCRKILDDYAKSPIKEIRLLMACAVSDPTKFLDDEDERVSKVAHIRADFEIAYQKMTPIDRMQNEFLVMALEAKNIKCFDGITGGHPEGYMCAFFDSPLFSKNSGYIQFDEDVFYNIEDRRILADYINNLIKEGTIRLADGCRPDFFPEPVEQEKLEKKPS